MFVICLLDIRCVLIVDYHVCRCCSRRSWTHLVIFLGIILAKFKHVFPGHIWFICLPPIHLRLMPCLHIIHLFKYKDKSLHNLKSDSLNDIINAPIFLLCRCLVVRHVAILRPQLSLFVCDGPLYFVLFRTYQDKHEVHSTQQLFAPGL